MTLWLEWGNCRRNTDSFMDRSHFQVEVFQQLLLLLTLNLCEAGSSLSPRKPAPLFLLLIWLPGFPSKRARRAQTLTGKTG